MTLHWYGDKVERRVDAAIIGGIDDTTAAAAIHARRNHPGWQNRTGTAEGSIRNEGAQRISRNRISGRFGSFAVNYFIWLELKHGSALRNAADVTFRALPRRIRDSYRGA